MTLGETRDETPAGTRRGGAERDKGSNVVREGTPRERETVARHTMI